MAKSYSNAIMSNVYAFGGNLTPSLTYSRAQSNTSKGMTKKLLCEFDPKGWSQLQDMAVAYEKAYFCEWV